MDPLFQILQLSGIFVIGFIIYVINKRRPKLLLSVGIAIVVLLAVFIALSYFLPR